MSAFLKLNLSDLSKGLVVAILAAVLGVFQQAVQTHGIEFNAYDWVGVLDVAWKVAVAYLSKNLISDENGKVFGKIG